jgi:hypothetical protein
MSPRLVTVVSALALAGGLALIGQSTWRIRTLEQESAGLRQAGKAEGDSFVETLQGEHASRLFDAFDRRRAVALARARARRNRLFGALAAVAGVIGLASGAALRRMAAELEEEEETTRAGGPPPGGPDRVDHGPSGE